MKATQRIYNVSDVITFSNTKGKFGGLSNMAPGYSLFVNEVIIPNTEALYQACRFPLFPDIQQEIIKQKSPMDAKQIGRKYLDHTRQDWDEVKFHIMRWCLMVKLVQNWETFGDVLKSTGTKPIVEYSTKDKVWAATPQEQNKLVGVNALGRFLMEIREKYVLTGLKPTSVKPLNIPAFNLFNHSIGQVYEPSFNLADFEDEYSMELA
jgi:ribA/ribD-fused uncharacterized protein